jgi:hypothetical protein
MMGPVLRAGVPEVQYAISQAAICAMSGAKYGPKGMLADE